MGRPGVESSGPLILRPSATSGWEHSLDDTWSIEFLPLATKSEGSTLDVKREVQGELLSCPGDRIMSLFLDTCRWRCQRMSKFPQHPFARMEKNR